MTPPDDRPPGVDQLGWEMAALKKQVEAGFAQVRSDMRDQLSRIEGTVERMAFVDVKLYASEQAAQNDKIESAVKLAMWSLGLVCTLTIASLVALLVRLVSA